ncbi:hypothetical protein KVR01_004194 [Diaporthe batatas]|uniref:uncharacterized protein n=1 Tax=Diaporthe batatas TaxID=748121 RepID=UPI001D043C4D|nr:uncharacterized protein KVR01_004194 [Diaporthe batatas]KAG8165642.1 hypothetical protein KVR01_004194 [Diaporthe batatas]
MSDIPIIQVLEKERYFNQHLVALPDAIPYAPLGTSSVRLRTKVMSLTSNNMTYAKAGFLMKWWGVHPLPPSTPAPFDDATKYGRINCWGFAEVLDSTHPSVEKGSYIWGYLPIGTLAQDLVVEKGGVPGQVFVKNDYRQDIFSMYNRYFVFPPDLDSQIESRAESVAYDAILRVMYETSYLINRFVFTLEPKETVSPGPVGVMWDSDKADLKGATIICLAPGSKVALSFARELRYGDKKPVTKVIGAASDYSIEFVKKTGEYDEVISTAEDPSKILAGIPDDSKIVLVDFGGRGGIAQKWATAISKSRKNVLLMKCGREISEQSSSEVLASFQQAKSVTPTYESAQINASDIRDRALAKVGEEKYFRDFEAAWEIFKKTPVKGLRISWGTGLDDVLKGWKSLARGTVQPDEGLVYVI